MNTEPRTLDDAGNYRNFGSNARGDLRVAQSLPPKAELTRLGQAWTCRIATGSAFTYVANWPTTRAELVLQNADPVKSLIIDSAWMYGVTSMAAAQPVALLAQLVPIVATAPTNDTAQLISSRSGKSSYSGLVKRAVANTAAGQTTNLWDIIGGGNAPMTTNLGLSVSAELFGAYIVPPGGVFALAGVAGTAVGTAIIGVNWFELALTVNP